MMLPGRTWATALLATIAVLTAGCGAVSVPGSGGSTAPVAAPPSSESSAPGRIASMVVVGHSGATGWNSNPSRPYQDALGNSWGSGDNPAVDSIYQRLLPTNPTLRDHAVNEAVSGSKVTDLDGQLDAAFARAPKPDLVLIQTVDNDILCDGTDGRNYRPFQNTLTAALTKIAGQSPKATILVVSSPWTTVADYVAVVRTLPDAKAQFSGPGPCDVFDPSGQPAKAHMKYQQEVIDKYQQQVVAACQQVPTCHYDGGALAKMPIVAADLTADYNHLSVAGQAKQAALEWKVLAPLMAEH